MRRLAAILLTLAMLGPPLLLGVNRTPAAVHPVHSLTGSSSAPLSTYQWNLRRLHVPAAWQIATSQGEGVKVCSIDTGVSASSDITASQIVAGIDLVDPGTPTAYADTYGHGTFTSSEIIGNGSLLWGVAPKAQLIAIKVLNAKGQGEYDVIDAGILACVRLGGQVANLSLGGHAAPYDGMADTIRIACNAGLLLSVAAGNDSAAGRTSNPAQVRSPCLIAVGASSREDQPVDWSNRDENPRWVLAPGQNVLGDAVNGGAAMASGTSMSAPEVAGIMALLRGMGVPPQEAVQIILTTTRHLRGWAAWSHTRVCPRGTDASQGCGEADAYAAVTYARQAGFGKGH